MRTRPITEKIPDYLLPFIAKQDASLYTPIDQASWRFILRIAKAYFSKHAHQKYLDGLRETGISAERIPLIEEMDQCLRRFGWRAVAVSGFIPPAVFLEFQSLGILPIACEMRTLEHLAYTPAPDIVHEAAGHAPIVADPEYAQYLLNYGEISRKAIFSNKDILVYEAVRSLSDIKENPKSTQEQIQTCQTRLNDTIASNTYVSEATCLARMAWWTVEYGLVGNSSAPKIYGAGLLSSVGESYHCLSPEIKKIQLTLDCINTSYDITRPQPQLFLTPDFSTLTRVLEEFSLTMAYRRGGIDGLAKAKMSETTTTTVLDSGIQISGVLTDFSTDEKGNHYYLRFQGPTQLAWNDREIQNQGANYHRDGFSTPIGCLVKTGKSPAHLTASEMKTLGLTSGAKVILEFQSGIEVQGVFSAMTEKNGKVLILSFEQCTVKKGNQILFSPEWGSFDMACGEMVTSVFGGAADRGQYLAATGGYRQSPQNPKTNLTGANQELNRLYAQVRQLRENDNRDVTEELTKIHDELEKNHKKDWLLRIELLELNSKLKLNASWEMLAKTRLEEISKTAKDKAELIARGLELL